MGENTKQMVEVGRKINQASVVYPMNEVPESRTVGGLRVGQNSLEIEYRHLIIGA